MYCHRCGALLNNDVLFCTECGAKLYENNEYNNSAHNKYWDNRTNSFYQENKNSYESMQDFQTVPKKRIGCGTCFTVLQFIICIIMFIWLKTDSGKLAITDISAYLDGGETYIEMIKTSDIELLNMTYGSFINQSYTNCNWKYFKDDRNERIVELNCIDRIHGLPVCIQFKITPIGNDLYYTEPCYISINGYTVNDFLSLISGVI